MSPKKVNFFLMETDFIPLRPTLFLESKFIFCTLHEFYDCSLADRLQVKTWAADAIAYEMLGWIEERSDAFDAAAFVLAVEHPAP